MHGADLDSFSTPIILHDTYGDTLVRSTRSLAVICHLYAQKRASRVSCEFDAATAAMTGVEGLNDQVPLRGEADEKNCRCALP